jgi:hypothetical protein
MRRALIVLTASLLLVACSNEEGSDNVLGSGATTEDERTTTTDGEVATTTTTAFEGSTSPTSVASTASGVALLSDVTVEAGVVTFTFGNGEVPGYDVAYVRPPIRQDASGEPMSIRGDTFLQIRMEPASGVDLAADSEQGYEETYTGPERIEGDDPIAEAARTGDFEANLTWVIGLNGTDERPYRVETDASSVRVYIAR